jgi:hypothetical protein
MLSDTQTGAHTTAARSRLSDQESFDRECGWSRRVSGKTTNLANARIESIRRHIAAGTYETPWRLEAAINRLLECIA